MTEARLEHLDRNARSLAERALAWTDTGWDEASGLFRVPGDLLYEHGRTGAKAHLVRETAWYALGLLLRDAPGDRARAFRALDTLLGYQFDAPGRPYHGTWYRSPAEPPPPEDPVVWRDYDPNWREFIGTTLAVLLLEYEARLPEQLVARIDAALRLAIAGSIERNVQASYTNIALMAAFLLDYGAVRFAEPAWKGAAERLAAEVFERFRANGAFDEYNSPTYYGIDLYALALWRSYASSALLRAAGAEMEGALWRDIAQYYHASMRNVAGPYDRSYGMDMRSYVAGLGIWISLLTGPQQAPFPAPEQPLEHGWDFVLAPLLALLGLRMPPDAQPHFLTFAGERSVTRTITAEPRRVATAWLGHGVMLGGEASDSLHRVNVQYHPATIHWLAPDGTTGWIRLRHDVPLDAHAAPGRLEITCFRHHGGDLRFVFQVSAPDGAARLERDSWRLPGLTVHVETNACAFAIERDGRFMELRYTAPDTPAGAQLSFVLRTEPVV